MPTDKERLDWMLNRAIPYEDGRIILDPLSWMTPNADVKKRRAAIDAAMKAERTRTKEEGR